MKKLLIPIFALFLLTSCNDEAETTKQTMSVDKHGTCVVEINQYNTERNTIVSYTDSVYNADGNFIGIISHKDTIPSLGMKTDTLETERTYTDANGDEQYVDTVVTHWRRYQMFINLSKNAN